METRPSCADSPTQVPPQLTVGGQEVPLTTHQQTAAQTHCRHDMTTASPHIVTAANTALRPHEYALLNTQPLYVYSCTVSCPVVHVCKVSICMIDTW